jgi:hypothetical protein
MLSSLFFKCAKKYFPGQWSQIWKCATSDRGRDIYRIMARKTRELYPSPNYMPWIVIDGEYDKSLQKSAQNNLIALVCAKAVSFSNEKLYLIQCFKF